LAKERPPVDDPRETSKDPLDMLVLLLERGWTVAFRTVYNGTVFHARAVQGEATLIREGRELSQVLKEIRAEALLAAKDRSKP